MRLPLLSDATFLPTLHRDLGPNGRANWSDPGLLGLFQFAWAMTLGSLRSMSGQSQQGQQWQNMIEDDETVMDQALENK